MESSLGTERLRGGHRKSSELCQPLVNGWSDFNLKKIILYGVRHVELRRDIEFFLDNEYEIAGYSDTYYTSDILDGKRFIPPNQLKTEEFDYIIPLSFRESTLADMKTTLQNQGIPLGKIIYPTMFLHQNAEKMQVDLIKDIEMQYQGEEGLIFGLSYSLRGIFEKKMNPVFFDCSWHGLDLYYCYRIFQYMRSRNMLSAVKIALLVFPYYFFNYDMSMTFYHYRTGQMFALQSLNDWHNYRQTPGAYDCVVNYQLFGQKISEFYHFQRYEHKNRGIYAGKDGEADLDRLWFDNHPETEIENVALYNAFISELLSEGIIPFVIVPPFYLKGLNQVSLDAFEQRKQDFYRITAKANAQVFDFSKKFANHREFFADLTHLNSDGARDFTNVINKAVLVNYRENEL